MRQPQPAPGMGTGGPAMPVHRALSLLRLLHHGSRRDKLRIFGLWACLLLACVALGLATVVQQWSGMPLSLGGVAVYITLYPPLLICMLLTLCWGWWWGAVPAWLATFSLALYAGMPLAWAALFACANPLGFAVLAIGYQALALRRDLRDLTSLLFFVQLSFVSGVFSSAGALIWCYTSQVDAARMLPIWQGWWLGSFLQGTLIVGPVLAWAWPAVERWQQRHAQLMLQVDARHARRRVLQLLAAVTAGVLLYGYATVRLAAGLAEQAGAGDALALHAAQQVLLQTMGVFFWVFVVIILFAAFLGYQLYSHWQQANDQLLEELHGANRTLEQLAHTDELSGLLNRRAADARLRSEWSRLRRSEGRGALLILDIDHFKLINDRHGHPTGDVVIQCLSGIISQVVRSMDIAARYGGEEFLIVLPEADALGALAFAERLRERVAAEVVVHEGRLVRFQISLGLAELRPDDADPGSWLARADSALYAAKQGGRNRTVLSRGDSGQAAGLRGPLNSLGAKA